MAKKNIFSLPELGEGIEEGTVISLQVKVGDSIKEGDTVIEVETDKAVLGVPANTSGTLSKWHIKEGDIIKIGDKLLTIDNDAAPSNNAIPTIPKEESETDIKSPIQTPETISAKPSSVPQGETMEVNFDGLGEGESGTVISLAVKEGDTVNKGDTLLELETDKAVVPFPAPSSGTITKVLVKENQEVKSGDKGFILSGTGEGESNKANSTADSTTDSSATSENTSPQEIMTSDTPTPSKTETESSPPQSAQAIPATGNLDYKQADFSNVHAGPATRKLAREIGVDLNQVKGSGRNGRISVDDVKIFAKSVISGGTSSGSLNLANKELPDFNKWGNTRREKTSKLRDTIAKSITYSWQAVPHVHQNDNINIDNILTLQKKWKKDFEDKGSTLSVTPFIIKALAQCLCDFPQFNSSYDPANKEVIFKEFYNIGVAVDTPQGLIVPVIKEVDKISIFDIGTTLKGIAAQTRDRTVKPEDLKGACITLSNLGGIGGSHFNPIINWPEVAILGVGRGTIQPIYHKDKDEFKPTTMLPTCLAYDHRVIDGADGARFMVKLKQYLENPDLLLMGIK